MQPGLDYFEQQLQTSLKTPLSPFKAARMLSPSKVTNLNPSASELDSLLAFPFFSATSDLEGLKDELAAYLATAEGVDVTLVVEEECHLASCVGCCCEEGTGSTTILWRS